MAKITEFRVGHCTHPSCMVLQGSGFKSRRFPSRAYLIECNTGLYLWDTGYAEHFHAATAKGVYQLYPLVTPVYFEPHESLQGQLRSHGVLLGDIHALVLSHFHADHVAGMRDFPRTRLLCAASGWNAVRGLSGLSALRNAFVPELMPNDIEARLEFIEASASKSLPLQLAPFTKGWDITGQGDIFIVDLPGHAAGHVGAFVCTDEGWTLLASDAAWTRENYEQLRGPSELTFLFQHHRSAYWATLRKLHALHQSGHVRICLSHEADPDYFEKAGF